MAGRASLLALVLVVPLLTWVGDALALLGGLMATSPSPTDPRAYVLATMDAITVSHAGGGLIKSPFLALAIGLIACGQGLATQGGAAAVGASTTTAVVLAIFGVIVINALFTLLRGDGHLIMPSSRPHIIVEDLRIGWGTRVLMEHVTFDIERGTTFAILGGSGSGKSTLLRYLIGLEQPMAGRIDIDGVDSHRMKACRRSAFSFSRARSSAP